VDSHTKALANLGFLVVVAALGRAMAKVRGMGERARLRTRHPLEVLLPGHEPPRAHRLLERRMLHPVTSMSLGSATKVLIASTGIHQSALSGSRAPAQKAKPVPSFMARSPRWSEQPLLLGRKRQSRKLKPRPRLKPRLEQIWRSHLRL